MTTQTADGTTSNVLNITSPNDSKWCLGADGKVYGDFMQYKKDTASSPTLPDLPDDNPKTQFGAAKPPLRLVPGAAMALVAMAFKDGAIKYGPANWREKPVSSTTYIDAAERHIRQWFDGGEENAKDSGCHHLAHAAACLMILLDAEVAGKLNDNRPPSVDLSALFERLTTKC